MATFSHTFKFANSITCTAKQIVEALLLGTALIICPEYNFAVNIDHIHCFLRIFNPFNTSCSKLLLFEASSAVTHHY